MDGPDGQARVVAIYKNRYVLGSIYGLIGAALKASNYYCKGEDFPVVGDKVEFAYNASGESQILKTLSRKTLVRRTDPSSKGNCAQVLAANVDNIFIVTSANRDFNLNKIQRYLTVAWDSGAAPYIVLSKSDLADDVEDYCRKVKQIAGETEVLPISVLLGQGLEKIRQILYPGSVSVFLGSSGVGKSTLVNAIAGEEVMETAQIRGDGKGRHTTTSRQMILLSDGAMIVDTPGMRELGVWAADGVEQSFANIGGLAGQCRFADCTHTSEPGCAVLKAVADGKVTRQEYENFLKIKRQSDRAKKIEEMRERKKK